MLSLYRQHWRAFLAAWLFPVAVLLAVVAVQTTSESFHNRALPYIVAALIVYFFMSHIRPAVLRMRREIGFFEFAALAVPFWLVALLCFALHSVLSRWMH